MLLARSRSGSWPTPSPRFRPGVASSRAAGLTLRPLVPGGRAAANAGMDWSARTRSLNDVPPAASQPRSQHGDLGIPLGRAVAVLDQPAHVGQAAQRPPRADEVEVDDGAVAGDDVAEVFRVPEREGGEVEQRIAPPALWPVDDAGDLVTGDEDVVDLQIAVNEDRCPRPECSLRKSAVAGDHVGRKDAIRDEPFALTGQARC